MTMMKMREEEYKEKRRKMVKENKIKEIHESIMVD